MAWYRSGTVSVTNNSNTVTGAGTSWVDSVDVGETFLGPDGQVYEITSIVSSTSFRVSPNYKGSTASAQAYAIMPTQGYLRDLAAEAAALVASYASIQDGTGSGKFSDGTLAAPGIRFAADENTGIRRAGNDDLRLVANGADQAQVSASGLSVQDAKLRITGSTDATKIAQFEVDGFTAATTRTFTLPNVSTTLVGTHNKITDLAAVTSAELLAKVTDETGTGKLVFGTAPTLVDPSITGGTSNPATLQEGGVNAVVQTDIGTAPNQVPLNQYLGELAFMNKDQFVISPAATAEPHQVGSMTFQLTNNTTLVVKVRGSDDVIRTTTLTLA